MAPVDLDRDSARDAAQQELDKLIYPKPSLTDRLVAWVDELLYRLASGAAQVPGGWVTVAVLVLLTVVALTVAIRVARNAMRTAPDSAAVLFGDVVLSAAEHRAIAEQHAADGDWSAAVRHRVRAVARRLEENGVLDPVAGRTATELAATAGAQLPALAQRLGAAATAFNDVTYGQRPASADQYAFVATLDDDLADVKPAPAGVSSGTQQPWAPVR